MRIMLVLTAMMFLWSGAADAGPGLKVLRVRDGKVISFAQMIGEVKKTDFVFLGEVHNMIEHHEVELAVIRAFHESDRPFSVGLEMFRADSQNALDSWVRGRMPLERFLPVYYNNWREPWPLYRAIFQYARKHQIPLVGLNIPDWIAAKVARSGFASMTKAELKELPPGIGCTVDATYMDFIRKAYVGHAMHDRDFVHFCEAQLVWDKSMAWHLIAYLKSHRHRTVIVLAGVGHAWKRGIPGQVATASAFTYRVILPLVPGQVERETVTTDDADYVLLEQ